MGYTIYCDKCLLHDSNLDRFKVISPVLNLEVNKAGEFTFQIAHDHVYYDKLQKMKSVIDIYEDGQWLWSGRIINIATTMKLVKTVKCEGELAFLHDSNQRKAEYHNTSVVDYFTALIEKHNADVGEDKQFTVGNVTVVDNNDELYRFSNYEDTFNTIQNKLIDRLGGYLIVRHEGDTRYIDYVANYPYLTNQEIRFGSNIIDLSLDDSCVDMISGIIPLGARMNQIEGIEADLSDDTRLTIESVNDGLDYILNDDAVERFGVVLDVVTFDDVTMASNLLNKGYEALLNRIYSTLKISLSVFDRSFIEENVGAFRLGASVVADSEKHGLNNQQMMIRKISMSLVDVSKTKIEIGMTKKSLTNNVVENNSKFDIKVENIVSDYIKNEEVKAIYPKIQEVSSKIEQTAENILLQVSNKYLEISEKEAIYKYLSSAIEQSASDITMTFKNEITGVSNTVVLNQQNLEKYIRFSVDGIELGEVDSPFKTNITNTEIYFSQAGRKIAYISNSKLYILEAQFLNNLTIGREETGYYDILVRNDKHWTLKYRGSGS